MGWGFFQSLLSTSIGPEVIGTLTEWVRSERWLSLDGFKYLNHEGILWLLLLCRYLKNETGVQPLVRLPSDDKQSSYALRVGIEDAASGVLQLANYPYPSPQVDRRKQWEFSRISPIDVNSLPRLKASVDAFTRAPLARLLGLDVSSEEIMVLAQTLRLSIVEVCTNVAQHSRVPEWTGDGYAIMRSMPPGYPLIRLMVGDIGIGLRARLLNMGFRPTDDAAAIRYALRAQADRSRPGEQMLPRQEGLFDIVQYTARRGGSITIRSGQVVGYLDLAHTGAQELPSDSETLTIIDRRLHIRRGHSFPGVQVMVDFRCPTHLDLDVSREEWR